MERIFVLALMLAGCASIPTSAPPPAEGLTRIVVEISGME